MAYVLKAYKNNQSYSVKRLSSGDAKSGHRATAVLCIPVEYKEKCGAYCIMTTPTVRASSSSPTIPSNGSDIVSGLTSCVFKHTVGRWKKESSGPSGNHEHRRVHKKEIIGRSLVMRELINRTGQGCQIRCAGVDLGKQALGKSCWREDCIV